MYNKFNKLKESLDKVEVHGDENFYNDDYEGAVEARIKGYIGSDDIYNICDGVASLSPIESRDGMYMLFDQLEVEDVWKISILLRRFVRTETVDMMDRIACELTFEVLKQSLVMPCLVEKEAEDIGYIEACEKVLGYYVPKDDFDRIHERTHEIIEMVNITYTEGGHIHNINLN